MNENENLVTENVAENVEQTTEETPKAEKTYTQSEVDAIAKGKIARTRAKIMKENNRTYGELIDVLKAGTGKESVEEITETFRNFYEKNKVDVPKRAEYTAQDIEVLARAEAEEIIRGGYDEVVEEVDRLASIGADRMTARDKALFRALATHRQSTERGRELESIGVSADVYNSPEFQSFEKKFTSDTPIKDIYDIYAKTLPRKEIRTPGSMKSTSPEDNGVKDFYSYEEASKFTKEDFDKNPELYKAVTNSMTKWE